MRAVQVSEQGSRLQEAQNPAPLTDFPKYTARTETGLWHFSSQLGGAPSSLTVAGVLEGIDATHILDRPLVDATGIQGNYDIELTAPAELPDNRPSASELIKAFEKQLASKIPELAGRRVAATWTFESTRKEITSSAATTPDRGKLLHAPECRKQGSAIGASEPRVPRDRGLSNTSSSVQHSSKRRNLPALQQDSFAVPISAR